jgi:hypothetical protein
VSWLCTQSAANSSLASLFSGKEQGIVLAKSGWEPPEATKMRVFEAAYGEIPCGE